MVKQDEGWLNFSPTVRQSFACLQSTLSIRLAVFLPDCLGKLGLPRTLYNLIPLGLNVITST